MQRTDTSKPFGSFHIPIDRRRFFKSMAIASAGFTLPGFLAEALTVSPLVTQGPYYPLPNNIPLDKDSDLAQLNDNLTSAAGTITYVSGRVLASTGNPIRGALVELWHADHEGDYVYSANAARNPACDANFAGFGQFLTGSSGQFLFRTIKAGLYQGRTRHFHWGVTVPGQTTRQTTQTGWNEVAYDLNGSAWQTQNSNDNVFSAVSDAAQRTLMLLDFKPVVGTTTGEEATTWDFVSGLTPVEPSYPNGGNLVIAGTPTSSGERVKISLAAYAGYSYEIYGNPTLGPLSWGALPFSLSPSGSVDRHIHTATTDGPLEFFIDQPAVKGFYYVSFRVPGANLGTPGSSAGAGGP